MSPLLILSLVALSWTTCFAIHQVQYQCILSKDGLNKSMVIDIKMDPNQPRILKLFDAAQDPCYYNVSERIVALVQVGNQQATPFPCGITRPNPTIQPQKYRASFFTASFPCPPSYCIAGTDIRFEMSCDFDNLHRDRGILIAFVRPVTKIPPIIPKQVAEGLQLHVTVDGKPVEDGAEVDMAKNISLRVTMEIGKAWNNSVEVKVTDCIAFPPNMEAYNVTIIKSDGCPHEMLGRYYYGGTKGFMKDTRLSVDGKLFVTKMGNFLPWRYMKATTVIFRCYAYYCYTVGQCSDSCPTGRRKRQVEEGDEKPGSSQGPVETAITFGYKIPDNKTTMISKACENKTYVIGVTVLGCILVLTLVVTVGMFVYMFRSRQGREKTFYDNKGMS